MSTWLLNLLMTVYGWWVYDTNIARSAESRLRPISGTSQVGLLKEQYITPILVFSISLWQERFSLKRLIKVL